jgi:predicted dehydrogenase
MSKKITFIQRRDFIKKTGLGLFGLTLGPAAFANIKAGERLRTAHIGVGSMGMEDLKAIASHEMVDVVALCDVDVNNLAAAAKLYPTAKTYGDYRTMLKEMEDQIDAVIVSTPDHTHAPASMMAMKMDKPVYCQKPLTHYVVEARKMKALAKKKNLVTQMGIQVHSFYDYKLATLLIQSGVIGKVHTVRAWSPKNWGYDGPAPVGSDPIPAGLDWDLWLGTSAARPFKEDVYHPGNWRQLVDYGCGTLGDMGVHIFDTPYNALALDVPRTIFNECREPNGFGFPVNNIVTYEFPQTPFTAESLKWVWYDGPGAPPTHEDLMLPNGDELPDQGAMFIGENGRLLLPHFQQLPRKIVDGKYVEMDIESFNLGKPVKDYASESKKHYHQFVDACLGNVETTAPFDYSAKLTETILLGVIAGRFPNETLNWDSKKAKFAEKKANKFLNGKYRKF